MAIDIPCPRCGKLPPPACACVLPPGPAETLPAKPRVRTEVIKMRREKRGGGREVILLDGFPKGGFDLEAFGLGDHADVETSGSHT